MQNYPLTVPELYRTLRIVLNCHHTNTLADGLKSLCYLMESVDPSRIVPRYHNARCASPDTEERGEIHEFEAALDEFRDQVLFVPSHYLPHLQQRRSDATIMIYLPRIQQSLKNSLPWNKLHRYPAQRLEWSLQNC